MKMKINKKINWGDDDMPDIGKEGAFALGIEASPDGMRTALLTTFVLAGLKAWESGENCLVSLKVPLPIQQLIHQISSTVDFNEADFYTVIFMELITLGLATYAEEMGEEGLLKNITDMRKIAEEAAREMGKPIEELIDIAREEFENFTKDRESEWQELSIKIEKGKESPE